MAVSSEGPYPITPDFEQAIVRLLVEDRRFFGSFAASFEVDALPSKDAQRAVSLCYQILDTTGNGPGSMMVLRQKATSMCRGEGKLTIDDLQSLDQYLSEVEDFPDFDQEAVAGQLREVILPRAKGKMLRDALMSGDVDPTKMIRELQKVEKIGEVDVSIGTRLSDINNLETLSEEVDTSLIPTGIPKLDFFLEGGAPRGELFVYAAETNGGKSSALSQFAVAGLREGYLVCFATNEDPETRCRARMYGDMLNVPWKPLEECKPTKRLLGAFKQAVGQGEIVIKGFPKSATPNDLHDWMKSVEALLERKVALLVLDYADKLSPNRAHNSSYEKLGDVYDDLSDIARFEQIVIATGSQVKTVKGRKVIRTEDLGDSRKKGEIARTIVSLNYDPVEDNRFIYMCKQKKGKADVSIGDVETDFAMGRYSKITTRVVNGAKPSDDWAASAVIGTLSDGDDPGFWA